MFSQITSVSFLVYTLLCVGSRSTDSWGHGPKTEGVLGGVKYHCLQCKRQFARSSQILEFHIFAPQNAIWGACLPSAYCRCHCQPHCYCENLEKHFVISSFMVVYSEYLCNT